MTNEELLAIAIEFDMGPEPIVNGKLEWWGKYDDESRHHVTVRNVKHPDNGPDRWAILKENGSFCLMKTGTWEWQSRPSERDDDYFVRSRFDSRDEAIAYYRKWFDAFMLLAVPFSVENSYVNYDDIPTETLKF